MVAASLADFKRAAKNYGLKVNSTGKNANPDLVVKTGAKGFFRKLEGTPANMKKVIKRLQDEGKNAAEF